MTRTAVLFIDSKAVLDGRMLGATPITDVPLVKRILIDLRRAGIENIFAVSDERTDELEAIYDDVRRTNFRRCVFADQDWRDAVVSTGDADALVLTADRLCDHRFLQTFADARSRAGRAVIAVDRGRQAADLEPEIHFTPNNGKLIELPDAETAAAAADVGVYRLPAGDVSAFEEIDPTHIRARADEYRNSGKADLFDMGNGFVEVIDSRQAVRRSEQRLVRYIWKSTDGLHGRMNKRIVLPLLKVLLRLPVTPNMISLLGVIVSIFSGYFYSTGVYRLAIVGGVLGVASSLLDHIDGSIARIKSKESAFGAHFDTICDYVFYISFAVGATIGLYRSANNPIYIWMGLAVLFGTLISLVMTSYRRTTAANASSFAAEAHERLDQNPTTITRVARKVYFIARRPALPYYLLALTVIGLLPFLLFMMALGTNLFWMFHVYTHRLFASPQPKNLN